MRTLRVLFTAVALLAACLASCHSSPAQRQRQREMSRQRERAAAGAESKGARPALSAAPALIATLEDRSVRESSGVVASRRNPGIFWTHNDSGSEPLLYAFDRAGRGRGTWRVEGARTRDWEDIAAGPGPEPGRPYLYAADIGDNRERRGEVVVYRFPEPEVAGGEAARPGPAPRATAPAEAIRLKYPDGPHDAEALLVHPASGDLYVVTKTTDAAVVFKLAAPFSAEGVNTLAPVASLRGPDFYGTLITGGDISPDGRRVVLCNYAQGYELALPEGAKGFDEVWRQTPASVPLGERRQGEAVCYRPDGAALLATSEGTPMPIIEVVLPGR